MGYCDSTVLLWELPGCFHQRKFPQGELSPKELETSWAALGDEDAARAYQAIWRLTSAPRRTTTFLQERLRPIVIDEQRLQRMIADLDHDQFAVRERASKELDVLEHAAEIALRQVLKNRPCLEVQRRTERILKGLHGPVTSSERLRALRAVEVLEHIGDSAAQHLLEILAKGAPEARLTEEAKASLARLTRRAEKMP